MEEPIFTLVITIGDVIDSTVVHINKGNPLFAREPTLNSRGTHFRLRKRFTKNALVFQCNLLFELLIVGKI